MPKRILIVEDEAMIAFDIETLLRDAGFDVAGPAATIEAATDLLNNEKPDAVILDGNLGGQSSKPVGDLLTSSGIPFVIVTGYTSGQVGDWIQNAPRISKPYKEKDLINIVKSMTGL